MSKFSSRLELFAGGIRHILADSFEVRVYESLNDQYYVTFVYPRLDDDSERYDALVEDSVVAFPSDVERGQQFVIKSVEEIRDGLRIYKRVEAQHVALMLGQYYHDAYTDFAAAQTLPDMLAQLGAGTPFEFFVQGTFVPQDIFNYGEARKRDLLSQLQETYGAERVFDNYNITLTTRAGANNGATIRYRRNLAGIKRKSHTMERITRLYGYGKNGLTIEGYSGHTTKYIDSAYHNPDNPYEGSVLFPEIESQAKLLAEMQKHLAKYELPSVTYDVDFVDLSRVDEEFESERIQSIGDTVTVYDEVLGYAFEARVVQYERYPFEPKRGRISLANFRELTKADYIVQAITGVKKAMRYTSTQSVLKGIKYDDSITLVDGLGMRVSDAADRELVRLGQIYAGEYGLALFNTSGQITLRQDAATGNAWFKGKVSASDIEGGTITGGAISGGSITGSAITGGTITGGDISGGTITGAAINGGTINVSTDVHIGRKLYLNPSSFTSDIVFAPNILAYADPSAQSLRLTAPGGVYVDNVYVAGLAARVAALEARPIYVPPVSP